jgi:hypothetical protein
MTLFRTAPLAAAALTPGAASPYARRFVLHFGEISVLAMRESPIPHKIKALFAFTSHVSP